MSSASAPPRPDAHLRDNHVARPVRFLNPTAARLPVEESKPAKEAGTTKPITPDLKTGNATPPGAQVEWRSRDNRKGPPLPPERQHSRLIPF